jgi:hypothetical protein
MMRWWTLLIGAFLATNTAIAAGLDNRDGVRTATIEAAAANARFGSTFCGFAPADMSEYKATVKAQLGEPHDFESDWDRGWRREQETILGYEKLRAENPALFARNVGAACAELAEVQR